MNITWPNFNRNQLILLVSGGIIVVLLMYALLRDSADTISLTEASHLIGAGTVDHAVMDGEYAYLSTRDYGVVKIQSAQLPHELMSQLKIERKSSYGWVIFVLIFGGILGALGWVYRSRFTFEGSPYSEEPVAAKSPEPQSVSNASVVPVKSTVRFSDIGGIGDVK
ncbi:MAG: hypothetical protein QG558_1848, partial [Campylobacterota bacterium]|nr:hypothetical protein [Campylobacterota bacterium]